MNTCNQLLHRETDVQALHRHTMNMHTYMYTCSAAGQQSRHAVLQDTTDRSQDMHPQSEEFQAGTCSTTYIYTPASAVCKDI